MRTARYLPLAPREEPGTEAERVVLTMLKGGAPRPQGGVVQCAEAPVGDGAGGGVGCVVVHWEASGPWRGERQEVDAPECLRYAALPACS